MDREPTPRPQPQRSDAWRAGSPQEQQGKSRKWRRITLSLALLLAIVLFYALIVAPFSRPTTTWVASYIDYAERQPWSMPLSPSDSANLQRVAAPNLAPLATPAHNIFVWTERQELTSWDRMLEPLKNAGEEVAVLYINGQGVSLNGTPVVLDSSFRPGLADADRLSIPTLFRELRKSSFQVKFVILDAGQVITDPALGIYANDFSERVAEAAQATKDESLWVLLSHRAGEKSWCSPTLKGSVFSHFVTRGLDGMADQNGDNTITLDELYRWVSRNVNSHVASISQHGHSQHPRLVCGAKDRFAKSGQVAIAYAPRQLFADNSSTRAKVQPNKTTWSNLNSVVAQQMQPGSAPSPSSTPPPPVTPTEAASDAGAVAQTPPGDTANDLRVAQQHEQLRRRAREAILAAWNTRDELQSDRSTSPLVDEPHRWSLFQRQLLSYERRIRWGSTEALETMAWEVTKEAEAWSAKIQVARKEPGLFPQATTATDAAKAVDPAVARETYRAELDLRLRSEKPTELKRWIATNWLPSFAEETELIWSYELASNDRISNDLLILALSVRQLAEQVAREHEELSAWGQHDFDLGEQLRLRAEEFLRNGQHPDLISVARQSLEQARSCYQRANAICANVNHADRMCHECIEEAGYFVHWHEMSQGVSSPWTPTYEQLSQFLAQTGHLANLLDSARLTAGDAAYEELQQTVAELTRLRETIKGPLAKEAIARLIRADQLPQHLWEIESLLELPLFDATTRALLLDAADRATANWRQSDTRQIPVRRREAALLKFAATQMHLQLQLLALGVAPQSPLRPIIEPLQTEARSLCQVMLASTELSQSADDSEPAKERAIQQISNRQRDLYQRLIKRALDVTELIASDADGSSWETFRELERILRVLDVRDITEPLDISLTSFRHRIQTLALMQPIAGVPSEHARWEGPETISLRYSQEQSVELQIQQSRHLPGPSWLVIDYDPSALQVVCHTAVSLHQASRLEWSGSVPLRELTARSDEKQTDLLRNAWLSAITPLHTPIELSSTGTLHLPLTVSRLAATTSMPKIVLRLISADRLVRHEISVDLSGVTPVQLTVDGIGPSAANTPAEIALHPWPNRPTHYNFAMENTTEVTKKVNLSVRVLPPGIDGASLVAGWENHSVRNETLVPGSLLLDLIDITMAPRERRPVPWQTLAAKLPAAPLSATKKSPDSTSPSTAPPSGAPEPQPIALQGDLICTIEDCESGKIWRQVITVSPQRPRNYVTPTVRYDHNQRRIDVAIRVGNVGWLPAEGIIVQGHFGDHVDPIKDVNLRGVLLPPNGELRLQGKVPARQATRRWFYLDVDDYPRAFAFPIPDHNSGGQLTESWETTAIHIVSPDEQAVFAEGTESIDVKLRVDAPVGSLDSAENRIVVRLDAQQDRDTWNDPHVILESDRQVQNWLLASDPTGKLLCHSQVMDQQATLPLNRLTNVTAAIRAELELDGNVDQSNSVRITLDSQAPRILETRLRNRDMVAQGKTTTITAVATDDALSGIARVEAAWDLARSGEFPVMGLFVGVHEPGIGWHIPVAATDVPLGKQTILVRAIDRAGHSSVPFATTTNVVDPALLDKMPVTVVGKVTFQGAPAVGADVSMADTGGKVVKPVKTLADGSFAITGVIPGKNSVVATIYHRNLPRTAKREIVVLPVYEVADGIELEIR